MNLLFSVINGVSNWVDGLHARGLQRLPACADAEAVALRTVLQAGQFRHRDHRFEWTREQVRAWAANVAEGFGYAARFLSVGPEDAALGSPIQMGVSAQAEGTTA